MHMCISAHVHISANACLILYTVNLTMIANKCLVVWDKFVSNIVYIEPHSISYFKSAMMLKTLVWYNTLCSLQNPLISTQDAYPVPLFLCSFVPLSAKIKLISYQLKIKKYVLMLYIIQIRLNLSIFVRSWNTGMYHKVRPASSLSYTNNILKMKII